MNVKNLQDERGKLFTMPVHFSKENSIFLIKCFSEGFFLNLGYGLIDGTGWVD